MTEQVLASWGKAIPRVRTVLLEASASTGPLSSPFHSQQQHNGAPGGGVTSSLFISFPQWSALGIEETANLNHCPEPLCRIQGKTGLLKQLYPVWKTWGETERIFFSFTDAIALLSQAPLWPVFREGSVLSKAFSSCHIGTIGHKSTRIVLDGKLQLRNRRKARSVRRKTQIPERPASLDEPGTIGCL